MAPLPPPYRRKRPRDPYARQVLGVRVRQAERAPEPLKLTEPRRKLMQAIAGGEVRQGKGRFVNDWRWHGETVTERVNLLIGAGWAVVDDKHPKLTDAGRAVLGDGAP